MLTHLEQDILECEGGLRSTTTNKANGGDGISVELFQILKIGYCESAVLNMQTNLENSSGHRTGKGQFSF